MVAYMGGFFVLISAMSLYSCVLILLRAKLFDTRVYRPMLLNIALAWSPVVILGAGLLGISWIDSLTHNRGLSWALLGLTLAVYLLAVPNATYLITELNLSHRQKHEEDKVPLWYDIISTLTLTLTGVLIGLFTFSMVQLLVVLVMAARRDVIVIDAVPVEAWLVAFGVIVLSSFGIYLGRSLRVNSWDVLHPVGFARRMVKHFSLRQHRLWALGYTVTYSVLLGMLHTVLFLAGWALMRP